MPTPLKQLREAKALSQDDLAKQSAVSKSAIIDAELRRRKPRPSTRRKLARALKVRPEDIEFGTKSDQRIGAEPPVITPK